MDLDTENVLGYGNGVSSFEGSRIVGDLDGREVVLRCEGKRAVVEMGRALNKSFSGCSRYIKDGEITGRIKRDDKGNTSGEVSGTIRIGPPEEEKKEAEKESDE